MNPSAACSVRSLERSDSPFSADEVARGDSVGLVDERAAAIGWPGRSPIGQRFRYSPSEPWITVTGVVGHVKTRWFTSVDGTSQVYVPLGLNSSPQARSLVLRTDGDRDSGISMLRSAIHAIDPDMDVEKVLGVADMYEGVLTQPRFLLLLLAALALVTASVGLYGSLVYSVTQRTREIGVRIALGATAGQIRWLVLREALAPVAAGLASGLLVAWWLARDLSSMLFETPPHDPIALAVVVVLLGSVATAAAYLPARRATRRDPVVILRTE